MIAKKTLFAVAEPLLMAEFVCMMSALGNLNSQVALL